MKRIALLTLALVAALSLFGAPPEKKKAGTSVPGAPSPMAAPASSGPDGWADLHWGMPIEKVSNLYPKATPSKNAKSAAAGWWSLDEVAVDGRRYVVTARVTGERGLVAVSMMPVEANALKAWEVRDRASSLEKALTLKYGPPGARGDHGPSWRFDRLDIDLTVIVTELINSGVVFVNYQDPGTKPPPKL